MRFALVCGASQGIGLAVVEQMLEKHLDFFVFATVRDISDRTALEKLATKYSCRMKILKLNAELPEDYVQLANDIGKETRVLDWCVNSIGILTDDKAKPERRLDEFDPECFLWSLKVNTTPTILLAKHLKPFFRKSMEPIFASISAKVGSIDDNRMGGWYSYRISKAAMNMAIKNVSIELQRCNRNIVVVSIHPGTTKTRLSQPFLETASKKYELHEPEETAQHLLQRLLKLKPIEDNGTFWSWDNKKIKW